MEPARRSRRARIVLLAFVLWTAFVVFALTRLLANSNPTVWIVHDQARPIDAKSPSDVQGRRRSATNLSLDFIRPICGVAGGLFSIGTRSAQIQPCR